MSEYTSILIRNSLFYIVIFIITVGGCILSVLPLSKKILRDSKCLGLKTILFRQTVIWVLPVIAVIILFWLNQRMVLDCVKQDFKQSEGIISSVSRGRNRIEYTTIIDDKYYNIPVGLVKRSFLKENRKYKFIYAVRSKLVLDIKPITD